jgi:uncharacterized protein YuzE
MIDDSGSDIMRIKYFSDTDTALLEFTDAPVAETRVINEDVIVDLDAQGRMVSLTIEHAKEAAGFREVELVGVE